MNKKVEEKLHNYINRINRDEKVYAQFTLTWEEAVRNHNKNFKKIK